MDDDARALRVTDLISLCRVLPNLEGLSSKEGGGSWLLREARAAEELIEFCVPRASPAPRPALADDAPSVHPGGALLRVVRRIVARGAPPAPAGHPDPPAALQL